VCGRYTLATPGPAEVRARFPVGETVEIRRRFNVAPGDDVLAVTTDREGAPRGELLRWGLVPSWAEEPGGRLKMINARVETVTERPAFRRPFGRFRCLIIADGFYEWQLPKDAAGKRAFHITTSVGGPFAFAGLWSIWRSERAQIRSCAILTTAANSAVAPLHDRMPVILESGAEAAWLDPATPREELIALLSAFPPRTRFYGRWDRPSTTLATTAPSAWNRRPSRSSRRCSELGQDDDRAPLMAISPLLAGYDNVVLDLDGVVWVGDTCTPGAPQAVAELRAAGKEIAFLTNDSRRSPEEYVRKLWSLGVQASLEEMVTAGAAIQHLLAGHERRAVYVIGSAAVFRHVSEAGHRIVNGTQRAGRADVVVVASHDDFDYIELRDATRSVLAGAEIVAANRDPTFPREDGIWPGTGSILAALEYATGSEAQLVGKPQPQIFRTALDRLGPGRTLVVGDRLDADLGGAAAAGLDAAIVLTGIASGEQARAAADPAPVAIASDLHTLVVAR
jgi:HAD superfamily hydrolase (TIGR01450 family)